MEFVLAARLGDGTRLSVPLPAEGTVVLGRGAPADVVLNDPFLSRSHLRFDCSSGSIVLSDPASSNGTLVNGLLLRQQVLNPGDAIHAGQSFFRLSAAPGGVVAMPLLAAATEGLLRWQLALVERIRSACAYAVLDGAVSPAVSELLKSSGAWFRSLYEGSTAVAIAPFGPFLVDLRTVPELLPHLLQLGWGRSWGVFLKSPASFEQVRRHLRTLLLARAEDGRKLLFRFYDPRVLPAFISGLQSSQRGEFFEVIESFLVESGVEDEVLLLSAAGEERSSLLPEKPGEAG